MVWLAKWIREHAKDARVLLITDRTELDEQIEKVFKGVNEQVYRAKSGADLTQKLNTANPWLVCSLIHKFGAHEEEADVEDIKKYIEEIKKTLPQGFRPKGNFFVFVDECHRTQAGRLHEAMKTILPDAVFIGFTGTPLLKADKKRSIEVFGGYIHTYKFHEAVRDKVVLDLRYEARDIDQRITSQSKIDQWFEAKTKALTPLAKAQLKKKWGTMQKVLSSQSRLEQIVADRSAYLLNRYARRYLQGQGAIGRTILNEKKTTSYLTPEIFGGDKYFGRWFRDVIPSGKITPLTERFSKLLKRIPDRSRRQVFQGMREDVYRAGFEGEPFSHNLLSPADIEKSKQKIGRPVSLFPDGTIQLFEQIKHR